MAANFTEFTNDTISAPAGWEPPLVRRWAGLAEVSSPARRSSTLGPSFSSSGRCSAFRVWRLTIALFGLRQAVKKIVGDAISGEKKLNPEAMSLDDRRAFLRGWKPRYKDMNDARDAKVTEAGKRYEDLITSFPVRFWDRAQARAVKAWAEADIARSTALLPPEDDTSLCYSTLVTWLGDHSDGPVSPRPVPALWTGRPSAARCSGRRPFRRTSSGRFSSTPNGSGSGCPWTRWRSALWAALPLCRGGRS